MKKRTGTSASALLDDIDELPRSARSSARAAEPLRSRPTLPRETGVGYGSRDEDTTEFVRSSATRRRIRRGLTLRSRQGRIVAGVSTLLISAAVAAGAYAGSHFLNTSPRFLVSSSENIDFQGNSHVTRSQMVSVFGEDIERNIFHVPLAQRRDQLQQIPWVEHATVMRLLPNHIRVAVTERTPVAFVRQGNNIGMVDRNGVLLDIPADAPGNPNYSFPVVAGVTDAQSADERKQRVQLYLAFLKDLDSNGQHTSSKLSEIDLSDPEDVKALLPDHDTDILVHFGNTAFLARYHRFQDHIEEWRSQYPRLSGVDLRYQHQAVLQMPAKDTAPGAGASASTPTVASPAAPVAAAETSVAPAGKAPVSAKGASARPGTHASAGSHGASKPAHKTRAAGQPQDMQRRVQAIREWMIKRQQHAGAALKTSPASVSNP